MGKKSKSSKTEEKPKPTGFPLSGAALDPTLSSLFASSVSCHCVYIMKAELTIFRLVLFKPPQSSMLSLPERLGRKKRILPRRTTRSCPRAMK